MPSPVGHALGGVIVGLIGRYGPAGSHARRPHGRGPRPGWAADLWPLAPAVLAAVAPDLDFLWGRHNQETHSLGAALAAGALALVWTRSPRLAVTVAMAWASHVLFDWLGSDTAPPIGVLALWPFSAEYYFANAYLFEAVSRQAHLPTFWMDNLWALATEVVMLGPLAAGAWLYRRRRP